MNVVKIILSLLAIWGLVVISLGLFGLQFYFPFNLGTSDSIPYHRWQTVRFSTFATLVFFISRYIAGGRPVSALKVMNVFFKFYVVFGSFLFWRAGADLGEWLVVGFFAFVSIMVHRESRLKPGKLFVKHW